MTTKSAAQPDHSQPERPSRKQRRRAAAEQKKTRRRAKDVSLLTEQRRGELAEKAAGGGLSGLLAKELLRRDEHRREMLTARAEAQAQWPFAHTAKARLTDRGFAGRGGGRQAAIGRVPEVRGTTTQAAGLYPFATGAVVPMKGTPCGDHLETGQRVLCDPFTWFFEGFITAPSAFVLALNGFGKSSFVRRQVIGARAQGQVPLILGDVKPDYANLIRQMGGQVVELGYGYGAINPLAVGALGSIRDLMPDDEARHSVEIEVRARQVRVVAGLIELVRGTRIADFEETLINGSLSVLYGPEGGFTPGRPPLLENLLAVIAGGGEQMYRAAECESAMEYRPLVGPLRRSLRALIDGPFGQVFNAQTTEPISFDASAVCIDVSKIPTGDDKLKAAVLMVCWADGFGMVEASNRLADAGLGPQRHFFVVMDELWQVLSHPGMVDRVDELTRLQRKDAAATMMITHTINDLSAFDSPAEAKKAVGFIDRARLKVIGPVGGEELDRLRGHVEFTATERAEIVRWADTPPPDDDMGTTADAIPYGMGKFVIKFGESNRPGIPIQMRFVAREWSSGVHSTNSRFAEKMAARPGAAA